MKAVWNWAGAGRQWPVSRRSRIWLAHCRVEGEMVEATGIEPATF